MHVKLASCLGIVCFIALAWGLSLDRKRFPWRTVGSGLLLQLLLGLLILKTPFGSHLFAWAQTAFTRLIEFSMEGAKMVFGTLADERFLSEHWGADRAFLFFVKVSATILVISAISSLLYHYGILQRLVRGAAWIMQRVMRTSGSESLSAAANIVMGQTEAPLLIKPYLRRMTSSELLAMMVGGMATIAGGVMAAYVAFGEKAGRTDMAGHLLTASVMNAPAGLLIAKILLPETEPSETAAGASADTERTTRNGLDALCQGASDGLRLALNVMAMLVSFVALVHVINYLLSLPQMLWLGAEAQPERLWTLQTLLGWVNAPFAWLMGVPAQDCAEVGQLLGQRLVMNEFVGYLRLSELGQGGLLQERSFTLATYAMCGFANLASIAIQIGGIGSLAPERRADLARLGLRALAGGALACYLSAAWVGLLQ